MSLSNLQLQITCGYITVNEARQRMGLLVEDSGPRALTVHSKDSCGRYIKIPEVETIGICADCGAPGQGRVCEYCGTRRY